MTRARAVELALIVFLLVGGTMVRLRVADGWVFAGSDSYAYLRLGDEWVDHKRFALGPADPLEWYRRPLYPLFTRVVRQARATASGDPGWDGWKRIERTQIGLDVLVTGLLVLLVARRLAGRVAGLTALALAMFWPPAIPFPSAAITEPLMALLTMATIACLVLGSKRPRVWFPVAAVFVALAAYLRPDGPINAIAFVPALFYIDGWKARSSVAALSLAVFVVLFAPWPARNVVRFGRPHLADGMVDRFGHDVPHYAGFWRWLQTWSRDERPAAEVQSCFYNVRCSPPLELFEEHGAFVAPAHDADYERAKVGELLELREKEGLSQAVSDGFLTLARKRRARHPWRVLVGLPLLRAWHTWSVPQVELVSNPGWWPWPSIAPRLIPHFGLMSLLLLAGFGASAALLLARRRTRIAGAILVVTILTRTAVLAWSAFCLPRYLAPIYPVCFVLIGAAVGIAYGNARAIATRRRQRHNGPRVMTASSS